MKRGDDNLIFATGTSINYFADDGTFDLFIIINEPNDDDQIDYAIDYLDTLDFDVVDTETQFNEVYADNIKVDTNYNDLYKLGVNYILSHKELTAPNLDFIERAGMYYIYKVK